MIVGDFARRQQSVEIVWIRFIRKRKHMRHAERDKTSVRLDLNVSNVTASPAVSLI